MRIASFFALALVGCGSDSDDDTADLAPVQFHISLENTSAEGDLVPSDGVASNIMFAPGIVIVHDDSFQLFQADSPALFPGFEAMVEDGNNVDLLAEVAAESGVYSADSFAALDADYKDTPMLPGDKAKKSVYGTPGMYITVATMFGESNDVFAAAIAVPLFDADGVAKDTNATGDIGLWDAGTEVNEEPGLGENQAPRQAEPGTGDDENGSVVAIDGTDAAGFSYPAPADMLALDVAVASVTTGTATP